MAQCKIWETPCESVSSSEHGDMDIVQGSPRAGGDYRIKSGIRVPSEVRARLTTWLIDQRRHNLQPFIGSDEVDQVMNSRPLPVHERADRLLKFLGEKSTRVGDYVNIGHSYTLSALAWSESTDSTELGYLLRYLNRKEWVQGSHASFVVTVDGYARIGELDTVSDPSLCFVAMWFDPSVENVYSEAIAPGIRVAGYEPLRIDREPGLIDRIDDAITAGIRRSHFLVVDLTHGDEGARGSVYYEAGFAHGLDKPVIFMCREDKFNDVQRTFDTRQYNTIMWSYDDLEGLRELLTDRILASARIGRGPRYMQ